MTSSDVSKLKTAAKKLLDLVRFSAHLQLHLWRLCVLNFILLRQENHMRSTLLKEKLIDCISLEYCLGFILSFGSIKIDILEMNKSMCCVYWL